MCMTADPSIQKGMEMDDGHVTSFNFYGETNSTPELSRVHQAKYKHDHKEQLEPGSSLIIAIIAFEMV